MLELNPKSKLLQTRKYEDEIKNQKQFKTEDENVEGLKIRREKINYIVIFRIKAIRIHIYNYKIRLVSQSITFRYKQLKEALGEIVDRHL